MSPLVLDQLQFSYNPQSSQPKHIVDNLSLRLEAGEIGCLTGGSGEGKTTLLRLIAGLERPQKGTITLGDRDMTQLSTEKRGIGLVFQDYSLFPHLNVFENIAFGLRAQKQSNSRIQHRVQELLERIGLEAIAQQMPHELSGGQMQRVALARALAPEPQLLLLDEPFSNLDPFLRRDITLWLQALLKESGTTVLLVTHDLREGLALADKVGFLSQGSLLQFGNPTQLMDHPVNGATAAFFGPGLRLQAVVHPDALLDLGFCKIPVPPRIRNNPIPVSPQGTQDCVDVFLPPQAIIPLMPSDSNIQDPSFFETQIEQLSPLENLCILQTLTPDPAKNQQRVRLYCPLKGKNAQGTWDLSQSNRGDILPCRIDGEPVLFWKINSQI
jgi:ABC-type sulfate/molybdate transport systems ATPase subunit